MLIRLFFLVVSVGRLANMYNNTQVLSLACKNKIARAHTQHFLEIFGVLLMRKSILEVQTADTVQNAVQPYSAVALY